MRHVVGWSLVLVVMSACAAPATPQSTPVPAVPAERPAGVTAEGRLVPRQHVALAFERAGTVVEVLVAEGDAVAAGQPLVRLGAAEAESRLAQAEAGLAHAAAALARLRAGASEEAIAVAQAGVTQAEAALAQVRASVSDADVVAARQGLAEARAARAQVLDGPRSTEVTRAQALLATARADLAQRRDALSAGRTTAALALEQAANQLREAQQAYQRIYWDNRDLERLPGDLPDARVDLEASALRAVENAGAGLGQARVAADQAAQAEPEGIAAAEARVADAEAALAQVLAPADADLVAAADARVAAAEAVLEQRQGAARTAQVRQAEAALAVAEATLAQVRAAPRRDDLAIAEADVAAAGQTVAQARVELDRMTLSAPFAGIIASPAPVVGESVAPHLPVLTLMADAGWRVDTEDLTELDVVRMVPGAPVEVRFDALPDLQLAGTVSRVALMGSNRQGDIVYTAEIALAQTDPRLRWNMTAVVTLP